MDWLRDLASKPWFPRPKVLAAILVGLLVYVLGLFGLELGVVLQEVADVVGLDIEDQQALATFLAAVIAGYLKKPTGFRTQ
jgi:hypothetical protein